MKVLSCRNKTFLSEQGLCKRGILYPNDHLDTTYETENFLHALWGIGIFFSYKIAAKVVKTALPSS